MGMNSAPITQVPSDAALLERVAASVTTAGAAGVAALGVGPFGSVNAFLEMHRWVSAAFDSGLNRKQVAAALTASTALVAA